MIVLKKRHTTPSEAKRLFRIYVHKANANEFLGHAPGFLVCQRIKITEDYYNGLQVTFYLQPIQHWPSDKGSCLEAAQQTFGVVDFSELQTVPRCWQEGTQFHPMFN